MKIRKQIPLHLSTCLTTIILLVQIVSWHPILASQEDCPWYQNDEDVPNEIKSRCICATNPASNNQLSIQCQDVDAQKLVKVLAALNSEPSHPLELLYLNGSHVTDSNGMIPPKLFQGIQMASLQLSSCNVKSIHPEAFAGIEGHLKHLSVSQNHLTTVPTGSLNKLHKLTLLDLSYNRITKVLPNSFEKLSKLATLKLNDNNVELDSGSLAGLETSLRNLNLKGTRISSIPDAITGLSSLAFLDLAQNRLRELDSAQFATLHSLTALNLERNLLQSISPNVFDGVNDTLSSLSLLNNLITHFPKEALRSLRELRVLDLGFNLLTEIPQDAFDGLSSLTLLALDGNPLATLSQSSFVALNSTLRGLSLGGRFLNCDCRLKWLLEWVQEYELQITSRERNPQFCGTPSTLREHDFYTLKPEDLQCKSNETTGDYDVNLLPEDIALLGIGMETGSDPKVPDNHNSDEDNASEQETDENRTTFTLEVPDVPPEENKTRSKYRFRRPRPTKDSVKFPLTTESIRRSTEAESQENNAEENVEVLNLETPRKVPGYKISSSASTSKPTTVPITTTSSSTATSPSSTTTDSNSTFSTPATASIQTSTSTTRNITHPQRKLSPIRSHNTRPKFPQRTSTTTVTSSTSTAATASTSTATTTTIKEETEKTEVMRARFRPSTTTSTTTIPPKTTTTTTPHPAIKIADRKQASKTISNVNIDDASIPVISGVGSSLPNLNSGSIVPVKAPLPVQAVNSGTIIKAAPDHTNQQHSNSPEQGRPPIPPNLIFAERPSDNIALKEIDRSGDFVTLHWESSKHSASTGFRIIYRMFGEDTFRHGPPLAATEREYRIKNIPSNECLVVCVVPYEDILYNEINPSAASIPPGSQCREVKPNTPSALMNNMDKITIGASAAICATVLLALMIFVAITKRAKSKRHTSTLMAKVPPTSFMTPSPGPTTITPGPYGISKEWDQMSVISTKSIPRARVFHGSLDGLANTTTTPRNSFCGPHSIHRTNHENAQHSHSIHRSYLSNHHHHHNHSIHGYVHHNGNGNGHTHSHSNAAAAVNSYLNNQTRLLRTSLGSRDGLNKSSSHIHVNHNHNHNHNSTRHFEPNQKRRRPGRLSQSESLNTLNGYETPDNWTDHDMDFYVARNPTRHDLVQL